jgi:putative FmdB family regulatory protein
MPLRDYRCRVCHREWEELRKDQSDPARCPTCKCDTVERKLSASSFSFSDGGYKHDYSRKQKNG